MGSFTCGVCSQDVSPWQQPHHKWLWHLRVTSWQGLPGPWRFANALFLAPRCTVADSQNPLSLVLKCTVVSGSQIHCCRWFPNTRCWFPNAVIASSQMHCCRWFPLYCCCTPAKRNAVTNYVDLILPGAFRILLTHNSHQRYGGYQPAVNPPPITQALPGLRWAVATQLARHV